MRGGRPAQKDRFSVKIWVRVVYQVSMDASQIHDCRFCLSNGLLIDRPLYRNDGFFVLWSIRPELPHAAMIVPHRHVETPFEIASEEWPYLAGALAFVKARLDEVGAEGYTLGWNSGAIAGQTVFHAHLHVIARFGDEPGNGYGISAMLRVTNETLA